MGEKEKILSKFNVKDYISELELVLENKEFDEEAKSLLLSIFYKFDNFYKDYESVKRETESKNKYLEDYINVIKDNCENIKILSTAEFTDNEKIEVDKNNKSIKVFPNEIILLHGINELGEKNIDDVQIDFTDKCLINMINKGKSINNTEPIRDFNGWSWNVQMENINNIEYNIIFQNLLILFGFDFVNNALKELQVTQLLKSKNNSEQIKQKHYKFIEILSKLAIVLYNNQSEENHLQCMAYKNSIINEIEILNNRKEYIAKISKENAVFIKEIQHIDFILNDIKLIREEFEKSLDEGNNKYFCISDFVDKMELDRNSLLNKIEENNKSISPKQYLKTQDKYKRILELYIMIEDGKTNLKNELQELIIELQLLFLDFIDFKISKTENKKDLFNIINDLRYYSNLFLTKEQKILEIEKIKNLYEKVCNKIIIKIAELKFVDLGFRTKKLNLQILQYIFKTKIMKLDNLVIKFTFEEPRNLNVEYYDNNMLDYQSSFEIPLEEDITNKKERKIKIF